MGIDNSLPVGKVQSMESLRSYLNSLEPAEQESYAKRCGTSIGYLRKALSTGERFREALSISLERESGGKVPVEDTRPDVDWAYLRGNSKRPSRVTSRRVG
jgi:DNA-binding transcriptional regulator YdaS (Cro superfamily)